MAQLAAIAVLIIYVCVFFHVAKEYKEFDLIARAGMALLGTMTTVIVLGFLFLVVGTAIGLIK